MGRTKQILILICLIILAVPYGLCAEERWEQSFPDDVDKKLERLQIYFETEMYEDAAHLLDELISEFPEESRFRYLKAVVDYEMHNYDRASRVFIQFIDEYPKIAEPYYLLGEINLKKGNRDTAKEYLAKYCELVPEDINARRKLDSIIAEAISGTIPLIKDGQKASEVVKKIGYYGACVQSYQNWSIRLINGSFRAWASMGIDFAYPLDLRGKCIVIKLKGKKGGEKLELIFRDKFAPDYNPQMVIRPKQKISPNWQKIKITLKKQRSIDLSQIVHMGLEIGSSTVQNPPNSTLFVKDIVIENAHN